MAGSVSVGAPKIWCLTNFCETSRKTNPNLKCLSLGWRVCEWVDDGMPTDVDCGGEWCGVGHDQVVGSAGARRMDDEARRKFQVVEEKMVYFEGQYVVLL